MGRAIHQVEDPAEPDVPGTFPSAGTSRSLHRMREDVDTALADFLERKRHHAPDACLPPLVDVLHDFTAGGKRVRPLFAVCGWSAAGGNDAEPAIYRIGAALELFHSFALIHDDIMDRSDSRRGQPTVHRLLAERSATNDSTDAAAHFGVSAAILLGDICLAWSDELLHDAHGPADRLQRARPLINGMRTETMTGQYLDMEVGEFSSADGVDSAWRVIRHKTAAYTVTRPLQIGAALAGADEDLLEQCADYGQPLGEAFQLRDDLLGVFGSTGATGKSAVDDLRTGKNTVLMGLTWQRAATAQRELIRSLHGRPELTEREADQLRAVIRETGAADAAEELITQRHARALAALERFPGCTRAGVHLTELAERATRRAH